MQDVKDWLVNTCKCRDVKSVRVTLGEQSWEGCSYVQDRTFGQVPYTTRGIYLVGNLPKKHRDTCFAYNGEVWYVAGWKQDPIKEEYKSFHPFGAMFLLMPGSEADMCDEDGKPYKQLPMTINYL